MKQVFDLNSNVTISVNLNADTGLCDTSVSDKRTTTVFNRSLPLTNYNALVDFLSEHDSRYVLDLANERFAS